MAPAEEVYELPAVAVSTLSEPALRLELHCIIISHYCMRAKWALQLAGLPFSSVHYLPLAHVLSMKRLQRRFGQGAGAGAPTASSKSAVATPVLAVYSAKGEPLCLLANSVLISRYAALRAKALGTTGAAHTLYGPSLTLAQAPSAAAGGAASNDGSSSSIIGAGQLYDSVADLELRLSGTMGIEVRRVMYHYLLPRWHLGGRLFTANASGAIGKLLSPLTYFVSWLLLPKAMAINAATAARGMQRLTEEFDIFDSLLLTQQQQLGKAAAGKDAAAGAATTIDSSSSKLPFYLCGQELTAADVSLAALAGHVVGVPASQMGLEWSPSIEQMPKELQQFMQSLCERPTGKFILDMWEVHGPLMQHAK